jgi:ferredoxin
MLKRKIIKIDEDKCNGCGDCIPNCPEGALQIIDEKARLISDLFCDGLGACIGECPQNAITIEERAAEPYEEAKVMENISRQGDNVIKAHLKHLLDHNEIEYFHQAVDYLKGKGIGIPPGFDINENIKSKDIIEDAKGKKEERKKYECDINRPESTCPGARSELRQWPIQINLVSPSAPYLKNADLVIAADCVPFAYASFREDFLKSKILLIGCPKFDDIEYYRDKISEIIKQNNIRSITCIHMEVPCCFGLLAIVKGAVEDSGKNIPLKDVNIGIRGEILNKG